MTTKEMAMLVKVADNEDMKKILKIDKKGGRRAQ